MADPKSLLERYVKQHNASARALGPPSQPIPVVEGPGICPLRADAITNAFFANEIVLWQVGTVGDDVAFANYAWRAHPRIGGLLRIQCDAERVVKVTLRPGYSRIFALIARADRSSPFIDETGASAFAC